ncbi:hypothetical protein, partial [Gracilinema caldarium]|uniref:hypothetical protein n=1 Tax=Gracilinema caldarium TaxID=215591 RepID=UPI0026F2C38B
EHAERDGDDEGIDECHLGGEFPAPNHVVIIVDFRVFCDTKLVLDFVLVSFFRFFFIPAIPGLPDFSGRDAPRLTPCQTKPGRGYIN